MLQRDPPLNPGGGKRRKKSGGDGVPGDGVDEVNRESKDKQRNKKVKKQEEEEEGGGGAGDDVEQQSGEVMMVFQDGGKSTWEKKKLWFAKQQLFSIERSPNRTRTRTRLEVDFHSTRDHSHRRESLNFRASAFTSLQNGNHS
ncbi:hypothetical protein K1719_022337 [Acacia pycnantha]|nr:hypothetical protein K1719_022337 [Acacia pycnantha]